MRNILQRTVSFRRNCLTILTNLAVAGLLLSFASLTRAQSPPPNISEKDTLNEQVERLYRAGKYADAIPIATKVLALCEKTLGHEHPDTATALNDLGELYKQMGEHARAKSLFERALETRERVLGSQDPETATSLNNLATLYDDMGDYAKAESLYQRALTIREKARGPDHQETAQSLNDLALLYYETGDYLRAEPLFQRAIAIYEKTLGPEDPELSASLNNLALVFQAQGEYAKAEELNRRTLSIREKVLGPDHPYTATTLNNLGVLCYQLGDYAKAEPLYQRALKIRETALGPEHPDTSQSLNNLAVLYQNIGDYAKAEPLFLQAVRIRERALGPEHSDTAISLNNLGEFYTQTRDYSKAEPLFERALKIREKALGPNHPDVAGSLNSLAKLYHQTGDFVKAASLYKRAVRIYENTRGSSYPSIAISLSNLALLYSQTGDRKGAIRLAVRVERIRENSLSNILSFTSEQQRLEFQKTIHPYNLPGTLGDGPQLAEIALRQKAVVLDSLLEDRLAAQLSGDPKQYEAVRQVRASKQRLMQLQLASPKNMSSQALTKREAEKKELSQRIDMLEAGLARQVAGLGRSRRALRTTVSQVQAALGDGEALIEFLRYDHYLGLNSLEARYGAVAILPHGAPKWIPLGAAADIERNIQLYQKSVRGETDEATLASVLHLLESQVWQPIMKSLSAPLKTVVLSLDGELNFVSFATLIGENDRFLGQRYSIRYVASGRDLLRQTRRLAKGHTAVFANPDFGAKSTSSTSDRGFAVTLRSIEMHDFQRIALPPLPGTAAEAVALNGRFGEAIDMFLGSNATEAELRKTHRPRILHLATHGFFLPETEMGDGQTGFQGASQVLKGKLVNPMHRSGIALTGAQTTLTAWSQGEVPSTENDGIVTAEEVGGLELDGTWLVVLSACDTGSGEARAGEGVMGLRRGFVQAGNQHLLMTLWPISDEITVQIMLDFYDAALRSDNAPQALVDTQRDWLVKLRNERGLLSAVQLAGPFIMSSQGKP